MANRLAAHKIATRYAQALFEMLESAKKLDADDILKDLQAVNALFSEAADLMPFLTHPAIPAHEKQALVDKQFAKKLCEPVTNLLRLLIDNDRMAVFPE